MKKTSKLLAIILSLAIICATLPLGAITASALKMGTTGDCSWKLNDTELSISGNGQMRDYSYISNSTLDRYITTAPWGDNITSVTIKSGVTNIGKYAFYGCTKLTSITIEDSVASIGDYAFKDCTGLTSIAIPNSVAKIGNYAFKDCAGLTSITISNSVISIGEGAFYSCTGLTSFTIPNSVTSIGVGAFERCTGLTSISIPNSITSIGEGAFSCCTGLTSVTVDLNNTTYHSDGNCIIDTLSKTLTVGCKNSIIPSDSSVTSIGRSAFNGCYGLTSIIIPNSVISIGEKAFFGCTGLMNITIPNSVTSIGSYSFEHCFGLTSIAIPDSVISIGNEAFYHCTGLMSIIMPNSVISIGEYAFAECARLDMVIYCGTEIQWNNINIGRNNNKLISAYREYHTEHIFNNAYDTVCNICGYVREIAYTPGDLDGNEEITDADAVYLLMYTFFPEDYPINQDCDFDGNGAITDADAVYLLMYTFFPEDYPIVKAQANIEPGDPGETEPDPFNN